MHTPNRTVDLRLKTFLGVSALIVAVTLPVSALATYALFSLQESFHRRVAGATLVVSGGLLIVCVVMAMRRIVCVGDTETAVVNDRWHDSHVRLLDAGWHLLDLHEVVRLRVSRLPQVVENALVVQVAGGGTLRSEARALFEFNPHHLPVDQRPAILKLVQQHGASGLFAGQMEDVARRHLLRCDPAQLRRAGAYDALQHDLCAEANAVAGGMGIHVIWVRVLRLDLPLAYERIAEHAQLFEMQRRQQLERLFLEQDITLDRERIALLLLRERGLIDVEIERARRDLIKGLEFDDVAKQVRLDIGEMFKRHGLRRESLIVEVMREVLAELRRPIHRAQADDTDGDFAPLDDKPDAADDEPFAGL